MDKLVAIELLIKVLLGEIKEKLPPNSSQASKTNNNSIDPETPSSNLVRKSKILSAQEKQDGRIAYLAANKTASIPDLTINSKKMTKGFGQANSNLQLNEWAYHKFFAGSVIDDETGKALEYRDLIKNEKYRDNWSASLANELERLAQVIRDIKGTNTIYFTLKSDIPQERIKNITYGRIVVAYKPHKSDPNRTRLTVGGDRITCLYDVSTPTSDLPTIKILWNSVLSTPGAKYFTLGISNFCLGTPMDRPEYMRIPYKIIPQEIIDKYKLNEI